MKRSFSLAAALLCPVLAFGDTLIMKNGNRFTGTFTSGNGQTINFREFNGNRQVLNLYDVQELRFGPEDTDSRQAYANNNQGFNNQGPSGAGLAASIDRLEADLRQALENSSVPQDQRQSLRDSRETLHHAMQVTQSGQSPDPAALRLAMDNVRSAVNDPSVRPADRERVLNDLDQTRSMFPGMNGDRFGRGRNF